MKIPGPGKYCYKGDRGSFKNLSFSFGERLEDPLQRHSNVLPPPLSLLGLASTRQWKKPARWENTCWPTIPVQVAAKSANPAASTRPTLSPPALENVPCNALRWRHEGDWFQQLRQLLQLELQVIQSQQVCRVATEAHRRAYHRTRTWHLPKLFGLRQLQLQMILFQAALAFFGWYVRIC